MRDKKVLRSFPEVASLARPAWTCRHRKQNLNFPDWIEPATLLNWFAQTSNPERRLDNTGWYKDLNVLAFVQCSSPLTVLINQGGTRLFQRMSGADTICPVLHGAPQTITCFSVNFSKDNVSFFFYFATLIFVATVLLLMVLLKALVLDLHFWTLAAKTDKNLII